MKGEQEPSQELPLVSLTTLSLRETDGLRNRSRSSIDAGFQVMKIWASSNRLEQASLFFKKAIEL
jgi:hypothetical protein